MELYRFDAAAGRPISAHGSRLLQVPLTSPEGGMRAACFHLPPGGVIGRHEAATHQLLCVVTGEGWVSGPDSNRIPIAVGRAAFWGRGEEHETGTDTGLTAIVLEGQELSVWAAPDT